MKKTLSLLLCLCLMLAAFPAMAADLPFTDVPADAWYRDSVASAYENGLIDGKGGGIFAPEDPLTCAEAAKLAACMYQQATEGEITLTNGDPWYAPYVDYLNSFDASSSFAEKYEWTKPATRAEFLEIFADALPLEKLEAVNDIPFGSIPDVPADHPQAGSIYRLYRAGIVQGSSGTLDGEAADNLCKPDDTIRRCEVAAILTRMTDADSRLSFTLTSDTDDADAPYTLEGAATLVIRQDYQFSREEMDNYPWRNLAAAVRSIRVEEGVTVIGDSAFSGFGKLQSVSLPDTLKTIGNSAFSTCFDLEEINIPDGVESIGGGAFHHVWHLRTLDLPDSVTSIGDHAFSKCFGLEEIRLPAHLTVLEEDLFFDCGVQSVILPEDLVEIRSRALCRALIEEIEIPVSVRVIEAGAFEDCLELKTVYYAGTDAQWNAIEIGEGNEALTAAVRKPPQAASAPAAD